MVDLSRPESQRGPRPPFRPPRHLRQPDHPRPLLTHRVEAGAGRPARGSPFRNRLPLSAEVRGVPARPSPSPVRGRAPLTTGPRPPESRHNGSSKIEAETIAPHVSIVYRKTPRQ